MKRRQCCFKLVEIFKIFCQQLRVQFILVKNKSLELIQEQDLSIFQAEG